MDKLTFIRMNREISNRLKNELRDKILDNMNLDDVPNIEIIAEYLNELDVESLLRIIKIAEALDWQLIGRIIGVVGALFNDKEV